MQITSKQGPVWNPKPNRMPHARARTNYSENETCVSALKSSTPHERLGHLGSPDQGPRKVTLSNARLPRRPVLARPSPALCVPVWE